MENEEIPTEKISASGDQTHFEIYHEYPTVPSSAELPPGFLELPPPYTPSPSQPIVTQPQPAAQNAGSWMSIQAPITASTPMLPPPNCPRGLEYLSMVDQLLVHKHIELQEILRVLDTRNKYKIRNTLGQTVYFAAEDSDSCSRNCCGSLRPFDMKIFDDDKIEVIHFYRPLACKRCCCPCCLQSIEVSAPPGNVIGSVQQEWSIFSPSFAVKNANGDTVFRIEGPFFKCNCGKDTNFKIKNSDGSVEIGKITKQWYGFVGEAYTDDDHFCIEFPMDLDVGMKAVLLAGLFLIDMMFYGTNQNNRNIR